MSLKVSRATFLRACGTAFLGAGVDAGMLAGLAPAAIDPGTGPSGRAFLVQPATASLFLPHLKTSFAVRSADGIRGRVVLAEVAERPVSKNVEQFSLIFHAPPGAAFDDGMHAFDHPALGGFRWFIVPVGASNRQRRVYQACFSRHLGPGEAPGAHVHSA